MPRLDKIGLFQKKSKQRRLRIYLFENSPGIFHFFTLSLEIPDKARLNSWIFHKIVKNTKTPPGNSTSFFLGHPWKFRFVFD